MQKDLEGYLGCWKLKAASEFHLAPLFGKIKNGRDVVLEDGTEIKAADYISAPRPGVRLLLFWVTPEKLMPVCV